MDNRLLAIKRLLMRLACHRSVGQLIASYYQDMIPHRSCIIATSHTSITPSIKASLFWGAYEKAETLFVKQFLDADIDVIELGSSIGVVSSHIARRLAPNAQLICVEANPELVDIISANVRRNVPKICLSVVHAAIDYSGKRTVALDVAERNVDSKISIHGSQKTIDVSVTTLSEICATFRLQEYALVADIEGAESGVLRHEQSSLSQCRQLIIELHDTIDGTETISVQEMASWIGEKHGFRQLGRKGNVFAFGR